MISIRKQYRVKAAYDMHERKYREAAKGYRNNKAMVQLDRAFIGVCSQFNLDAMRSYKYHMKRHLRALHRLDELYPTLLLRLG